MTRFKNRTEKATSYCDAAGNYYHWDREAHDPYSVIQNRYEERRQKGKEKRQAPMNNQLLQGWK